MRRTCLAVLLLSFLTAAGGCAMCASPYDCFYGAYGGRRQRIDMTNGRVGSAFASAESTPVATDMPSSDEALPTDDGDPSVEPMP